MEQSTPQIVEQVVPKTVHNEQTATTRREDVLNNLIELGKGNIPIVKLAEKWSVNVSTIYNDVDKVIDAVPIPKVEAEAKKILLINDKILTTAQAQLFKSQLRYGEIEKMQVEKGFSSSAKHQLLMQGGREINASLQVLIDALNNQTAILEQWGFKEKIAEKLDIRTLSIVDLHKVVEKVKNAGREFFSYADFEQE